MTAVGCEVCSWLWRCESRPLVSPRAPYCRIPPRFGWCCAASLWGTRPPQAAPTTAALVVMMKVLRLSPVVFAFLSMVVLLEHVAVWHNSSVHQSGPGSFENPAERCVSALGVGPVTSGRAGRWRPRDEHSTCLTGTTWYRVLYNSFWHASTDDKRSGARQPNISIKTS